MSWDLQTILMLNRIEGLGPNRLNLIVQKFTQDTFMSLSMQDLLHLGLNVTTAEHILKADLRAGDADLAWQGSALNHHIITVLDPHYPKILRECHGHPPVLFIKGNLSALDCPGIAMVGSRKASARALHLTHSWANRLSHLGLVIISGGAIGIDAAAHQGALAGGGKTVAVMATGMERIYPARHQALAEKICVEGCLVSEYPVGTILQRYHFPRRNRIMSGLSQACLVVEAAQHSGSMITARWATEQNKALLVVSGAADSQNSSGNIQLIRQGANCVGSYDDLLQDLTEANIPIAPVVDTCQNVSQQKSSAQRLSSESLPDQAAGQADAGAVSESSSQLAQLILMQCTQDLKSLDELVAINQSTPSKILAYLSQLEYQGLIKRSDGLYQAVR